MSYTIIYGKQLLKTSHFCHKDAHALKFSSAKHAQKYIDKLGCRFKDVSYAVVQSEEV
mgnify:FL=1